MSLVDIHKYLYNYNIDINDKIFLKNIYEKMINIYDENILSLYFENNYEYIYEETNENKIRRKQQKFRENIIDIYKTCIITGIDSEICEASHIVPFCDSNNNDKYDMYNGLLLSPDMHRLFDKNYLIINPDTLVLEIIEKYSKVEPYKNYHGKKIKYELHKKTIQYLKKKYM